ncbi:hypothetical protein [Algoriphagus vanfongensis]|uniref:hypothetical protein n=1 Tax=Algoriphagus vanfongensis TaxID=426371 RepID=UPI00047DF2F2|nr:hypothetical protein [Algoriphagus vanfongensis]
MNKYLGSFFLLFGVLLVIQNIKLLIDRNQIRDIKLNGVKVESVVKSNDCENTGFVTFETSSKKLIEMEFDSDCWIFEVGNTQVFYYSEKYPGRYIFPNESISTINDLFILGLAILSIVVGTSFIKKRRPAPNNS